MPFHRRGLGQLGQLPNLVSIPSGYAIPNQTGLELANLAAWHYQRIGQMGYLAAPPEGSLSQPVGMPSNPASTARRVWLDEPPGSVPFDEQGTLALPPAAGFGVNVPIVDFFVPLGFDGVIKWVSNNVVPGPLVPGSIIWKLLVNSRAVRNFANITVEKGTPFQGRIESPIRIFSGDHVQYVANVPTGSAITGETIASATGYYFPSKGIS